MKIYYANIKWFGEFEGGGGGGGGCEKIVDIDGYNGIMIHYSCRGHELYKSSWKKRPEAIHMDYSYK